MSTPENKIPTGETDSTPAGGPAVTNEPVSEPVVEELPVVDPYAGTRVAGMSPEQVAEYIKLLEVTTTEQKDRLTLAERSASTDPVTPPAEEKRPDFFDDPYAAVELAMAKAVAPINEQIAAFRTQGVVDNAWTAVEREIDDFGKYKHLVEQLVTSNNVPAETITVDLLRHLYYTALGFATRQGGIVPTPETTPSEALPHIPQHRPSAAPLTTQESGTPKLRELTENERVLARFNKMTDEEYLRLQDEDLELDDFAKKEKEASNV